MLTKQEVYTEIEQHYRKHYAPIVSRYSRYAGGYHNAEDVVQEAYTRACQYWEACNTSKGFNGWFSQILVNCLRDKIGDERTRGAIDREDFVTETRPRVFNKLLVGDVKKIIDDNKPEVRDILNLYFFKEMKTCEIAEIVPQSHSNVRTIISNFRKGLRSQFGSTRIFV
jgi:RNA polymerase sigma factor (sigma-70 family)